MSWRISVMALDKHLEVSFAIVSNIIHAVHISFGRMDACAQNPLGLHWKPSKVYYSKPFIINAVKPNGTVYVSTGRIIYIVTRIFFPTVLLCILIGFFLFNIRALRARIFLYKPMWNINMFILYVMRVQYRILYADTYVLYNIAYRVYKSLTCLLFFPYLNCRVYIVLCIRT